MPINSKYWLQNQNPDETQVPPEMAQEMAMQAQTNPMDNYASSLRAYTAAHDRNQEILKNYMKQYEDSGSGKVNLVPAAAFISGLTGNQALVQAAKENAPESQSEKARGLFGLQQKISGDELDYIKNMLQQKSYEEKRKNDLEKAKITAKARAEGGGNLRGLATVDRLAAGAADKIHNDKLIQRNEQQRQQIELDRHTLNTAEVLTPQIFNEIQIGLANAISGGRTAAVSTQNKVEFESLATQLSRIKQKVTNRPEDINSPEVRKMLSDTMERLTEAYENNSYNRAQQKMTGAKTAYKNIPQAYEAMKEAVDSYKPPEKKEELVEPPPGWTDEKQKRLEELRLKLGK